MGYNILIKFRTALRFKLKGVKNVYSKQNYNQIIAKS